MTKSEFALFAAALKTYYPREQLLPNTQALELWFGRLQDIPYQVAETALNKWVVTNKWPPSIADIREQAAEIVSGDIPEWSKAWETVLIAIRNYGMYDVAGAMNSFDDLTYQCVQRLGFKELCMSTNISVDRANFRMIYEQLVERKKIEAQMPVAIQELIKELRLESSKKRLTD